MTSTVTARSRNPYPFQQEAIAVGLEKNLLVNDAPGLGKSLTSVEILRTIRDRVHLPSLVVTTKRAKEQFKGELIIQGIPEDAITIGGVDPIWVPDMEDWVLILHYEAVVRHLKGLRKKRWGTIVIDEGHYIKNFQAQRTRAVKKLKAERKIVLTGTPVEKSPAELHSILEFLYPEVYLNTRGEFCARYERAWWDDNGYKHILPGAKNPEELASRIRDFTFARTKEEVAPWIPKNIITDTPIILDGPQLALYKRIEDSADLEVCGPELDNELYIPTRLAQLSRLAQAAVDPQLIGSRAQSAKFEWLRDWRADNPEEPIIIFTTFRETAITLAERYDAHLIIGGREMPSDLKSKNTIVSTIAAGGTALNLGWIRTSIFMDINWRWNLHDQAMNRIHRLDITEPKQTIYLIAKNTVDEIMLASVRNKWSAWETLRGYVKWRGK